jgi:hypothetical protein
LVIALDLLISGVRDKRQQILVRGIQKNLGQFLEIPFIALVHIILFAFGETADKKRPFPLAEQNNGSVTARFSSFGRDILCLMTPPP